MGGHNVIFDVAAQLEKQAAHGTCAYISSFPYLKTV